MSALVIVESPAKAKTIQKYLGPGYEVVASMGHVRDLPKSKLGIDVNHNFEPEYIDIISKKDLIKSLKKKAAKASCVYLATDPDREGEAISWHLANLLGLDLTQPNRVTFNEITQNGIKTGMQHPRTVNMDLVDAQQARRVLDRLVGYKLSPFLWKKVRKGLSAGRVQSVAVRLIVDRQQEINAFVPQEYWHLDAKLSAPKDRKSFLAQAILRDGKKLELHNEQEAKEELAALNGVPYIVSEIKTGTRRKNPAPPFTTSTLQQEASRKLSFQSFKTMRAAQELYEGVEIEDLGAVGLITYMRTDSLRISAEAADTAAEYIAATYGPQYVPKEHPVYKSRSNAQDAHEAIRPTMPLLTPDKVKASLSADQYKIYKLVWERFIASQMEAAVYNTVAARIQAGEHHTFGAHGFSVRFDGFTALYEEGKDEESKDNPMLPPLEKGMELKLRVLQPTQHFTQPPAAFTEATLIKTLEEKGIGRPSTYAPTISTILQRGYVERSGRSLIPTPLGEITTGLMKECFPEIVNVDFTAQMENDLDEVESGETEWAPKIRTFYDGFAKTLAKAEEDMADKKLTVPDEETDVVCEKCGRKMVVKTGRYGKFLACPGYPECKNTKRIVNPTQGECPLCGARVLQKKSKAGRVYYGCENNGNPDESKACGVMTWDEPISERCPKCSRTLFRHRGKNGRIFCAGEGCGYERQLDAAADKDK